MYDNNDTAFVYIFIIPFCIMSFYCCLGKFCLLNKKIELKQDQPPKYEDIV